MMPLAECRGVDRAAFERDWLPRDEPVVLRGLVGAWPLVRAAREGDAAVAAAVRGLASEAEVDALMLRPEHRGRIFYGDSDEGFNYLRNRLPLARVLDQIERYARFARAPAVAIQSAPAAECAPGFAASHPMPLLDAGVAPRWWLGTAIVTPAHFDESANIACVAAGERTFTLFPPAAVGDLYIGPLDHAPTGTPISVVDFAAPDPVRFPRFARALEQARSATLGPGDAIFIPPLWWHHVASLRQLNLLVNYWWKAGADAARDAMLRTLQGLGPAQA